MEKLRMDRENTGNLKMQFEWVPCCNNEAHLLDVSSHWILTFSEPLDSPVMQDGRGPF